MCKKNPENICVHCQKAFPNNKADHEKTCAQNSDNICIYCRKAVIINQYVKNKADHEKLCADNPASLAYKKKLTKDNEDKLFTVQTEIIYNSYQKKQIKLLQSEICIYCGKKLTAENVDVHNNMKQCGFCSRCNLHISEHYSDKIQECLQFGQVNRSTYYRPPIRCELCFICLEYIPHSFYLSRVYSAF